MIEQYEAGGDPKLSAAAALWLSLAHKHLPEMMAHTGLTTPPLFMPIVGQLLQGPGGDGAAAPVATAGGRHGASACTTRWSTHYAGERFVHVMPLADPQTLDDGFFDVQACNDSNRVELFVFASDSQVLLACAAGQPGQGRQRRGGAVR